ncbi:hypothetical protein [Nocardioides dongxiaopingii]|uniref:hypothetical protein n=1 Tax=Nocardioides sp. S-1144 TaxID=2582905 RepID=UPI001652226C|nr:hypothetical protein [Nocardioides sp. S-1144]
MTFLLLLTALAVLALVGVLRSVLHDGPARPPLSHAVDPDFTTPSSTAHLRRAA